MEKLGEGAVNSIRTLYNSTMSPLEISESLSFSIEEVEEVLEELAEISYTSIVPRYIFSYNWDSTEFYRMDIESGELVTHHFPNKFISCISWCEIPGDFIYLSGGKISFYDYSRETSIVNIHTFEVTPKAPMNNLRFCHASAYYRGYVYVIGGQLLRENLVDCERYSIAKDEWEIIPSLPKASHGINSVIIEPTKCLYVIGGNTDEVQELNLLTLSWRVLPIQLPGQVFWYPVFRLSPEAFTIYFLYESKLYSIDPQEMQLEEVKTVSANFQAFCGPSYYNRSTLYIPNIYGAPERLEIGSI